MKSIKKKKKNESAFCIPPFSQSIFSSLLERSTIKKLHFHNYAFEVLEYTMNYIPISRT